MICRVYFKQVLAHLLAQLNGFKYAYIALIIQFHISHLFVYN